MIADARHIRRLLPLLILLFAPAGTNARPAIPADHEARIGACIREASGGKAWLEKTLWGLRDQEAGWIGAEIANTNGSHDLGPLQINSFWLPRLASLTGRPPDHVRAWLISDPCFNVQAARWIFLSALSISGDFWKAIGVYHSPTGWRQQRYANQVASKLTKRFGREAFVRTALAKHEPP